VIRWAETPRAPAQTSWDLAAREHGHCCSPCGSSPRSNLDLAFFPVLVGGRQGSFNFMALVDETPPHLLQKATPRKTCRCGRWDS